MDVLSKDLNEDNKHYIVAIMPEKDHFSNIVLSMCHTFSVGALLMIILLDDLCASVLNNSLQ